MVPISATATNKSSFPQAHVSSGEEVEVSEPWKRRCSHTLPITYYRKSDIWNCSFYQFLGFQKYPPWRKNKERLLRIPLFTIKLLFYFMKYHSVSFYKE